MISSDLTGPSKGERRDGWYGSNNRIGLPILSQWPYLAFLLEQLVEKVRRKMIMRGEAAQTHILDLEVIINQHKRSSNTLACAISDLQVEK